MPFFLKLFQNPKNLSNSFVPIPCALQTTTTISLSIIFQLASVLQIINYHNLAPECGFEFFLCNTGVKGWCVGEVRDLSHSQTFHLKIYNLCRCFRLNLLSTCDDSAPTENITWQRLTLSLPLRPAGTQSCMHAQRKGWLASVRNTQNTRVRGLEPSHTMWVKA